MTAETPAYEAAQRHIQAARVVSNEALPRRIEEARSMRDQAQRRLDDEQVRLNALVLEQLDRERTKAVAPTWVHTRDGSVCSSYRRSAAPGSWWCPEHEQFVRVAADPDLGASNLRSV